MRIWKFHQSLFKICVNKSLFNAKPRYFCSHIKVTDVDDFKSNHNLSSVNTNVAPDSASEGEKNLAMLKMEYELLRYDMINHMPLSPNEDANDGDDMVNMKYKAKIPSVVKEKEWEYLLTLDNKNLRLKYYRYLFKNEMSEANLAAKKEKASQIRRAEREAYREKIAQSGAIDYGLNGNTMFFYIRESAMKQFRTHTLAQNKLLGGPELILDFDFEQHMNAYEKGETANQLRELHALNKRNRAPFNLIACNCHNLSAKDSTSKSSGQGASNEEFELNITRGIPKAIPKAELESRPLTEIFQARINDPHSFVNFYAQSYLDLYPKNQIVYLSPNAPDYMTKYDPNAIYVMAALVEKGSSKPYTLAKSKRERIRTLKLPIDLHLRWGHGAKDLPLNHVLGILLDFKNTGDWKYALSQHIPTRKLFNAERDAITVEKRFGQAVKSTVSAGGYNKFKNNSQKSGYSPDYSNDNYNRMYNNKDNYNNYEDGHEEHSYRPVVKHYNSDMGSIYKG